MANKNIIFNMTLESYNKKYHNRKYRLLKFTKKEIKEIENKNNVSNLLEGRKWALIKDTYYEIPKAPRFTWFRNLNAGVQVGCCLLGAGVVATAVTVPLVLLNQNQTIEPSITIQGADFDKKASHIKLNKDSYIVLKEKSGKTISDVEEVKVGGKVITRDIEWTYDKENKKVNIKAEAMTSTKIEIKVKTENPHIVDLKTWIEKANKLNADFLSSTLEYTLDQVTKYVEECEEKKLIRVEYINKPGEGRKFWIYFLHEEKSEEGTEVANSNYSGDQLIHDGYITNNGICEIYDDEIVYKNENAGEYEYKELHINKFGYPTYELWRDGTFYEIKFNSEPTEPVRQEVNLEWNQGDNNYEWSAKNEIKAGTKFKATLSHTSVNMPKTNKLSPYPNTIIFSLTDTTADVYIENVTYNDGTKVSDLSISDNSLLYAGSEGTNKDVIFYFTVNKDYASSKFNISAIFFNS